MSIIGTPVILAQSGGGGASASIVLTVTHGATNVTCTTPNGLVLSVSGVIGTDTDVYTFNNLTVYGNYVCSATFSGTAKTKNCEIDSAEQYELRFIGLPSGYEALDYIESTGTQYLITDYNVTANFEYYVKVAITDSSVATDIWPSIIGSQYLANGSDGKVYQIGYNPSKKAVLGVTYTIGNIYELTYKLGSQSVNGVVSTNTKTWSGSAYGTTVMFTRRTSEGVGASSFRAICRIYAAKIYENNVLIRRYCPAKRIYDNAIGMYETINSKFITNSGTGTFLYG